MTGSLSGDSTLTLGKSAPFLPHERAKMPHNCPRFHVMSTGSHNRHSLFWVKGLQLFFELILPGATFHLTSTIEFHALPLRALFLCPQPCHQPPVFEHVAEPSLPKVAVMGKDVFPQKWPKPAPFFSVFSVWRTESSPALKCVAIRINSLKTRLTRHVS